MSGPFAEGGPPGWACPLDNDDPAARIYHGCLATLYDPFSRRRTSDLFPIDGLCGKRCLEVGAGVGARFAVWLAGQVGPTGHVVTVDLKPRDIPAHPRLEVREHDLARDGWSAGEKYDFIHARLTLAHLPRRRDILTQLVGLLAPGGWILVEDWDTSRTDMILHAPSLEAAEECVLIQETVSRIFAIAGTDRGWARRVHAALLTEGLTDVHTIMYAESWTGGGPGAHLAGVTIDQLRPALLAAGLAERQLDRAQELLSDPSLVLAGHPLYSTAGRRPTDPTIHEGD